MSNLKLQKLLYYCEAWYLVFNYDSLFEEPIEAWVHGPVVPRVFHDYKYARWSPIVDVQANPISDPEIQEHLSLVLDAYGEFEATQLERLTHQETPWIEARCGLPSDAPSRSPISRKTMREFYSSFIGQEE